jgi:hypothetical protein
MSKRSGNDSKYFTTTKKGEIHELKEELHHQKPEKQKDAVKKVRCCRLFVVVVVSVDQLTSIDNQSAKES